MKSSNENIYLSEEIFGDKHKGMGEGALMLYVYINYHAQPEDGSILDWVGIPDAELAGRCDMSVSRMRQLVNELECAGLIKAKQISNASNGPATSYHVPALDELRGENHEARK